MTSIRLFEVQGYLKYLFHNRSILHCGSGYTATRICAPTGLNIAFLSTVLCGNRTKFHSQQTLHGAAATMLSAPTRHNRNLCKHKHIDVSLLDVQLCTYCCSGPDIDLEQSVQDIHNEDSEEINKEEFEVEGEHFVQDYSLTSKHKDSDPFHREFDAEWEEEFGELKEMLKCTDENLVELVTRYPRLKDKELLKQVKGNVRILLDKDIKKNEVVSKLLSSKGMFLQTCPSELSDFFKELENKGKKIEKYGTKSNRGWYTDLSLYLLTRLKGHPQEENLKFLALLLNVKYEVMVKLNKAKQLDKINHYYFAYLLKEKVDFLLYEGLVPEDIAYNIELLLMSLKFLGASTADMKATVGEISIPTLKLIYYKRVGLRDIPPLSKVHLVLDSSLEDFTELQRVFLNRTNQTDAINVALYLLDKGIDKQEIISNPYVLGHKLDKVRDCFEKNFESFNASTLKGQRRLLNLVVYDLEYRYYSE